MEACGQSPDRVVLVGFMGAGKTALARRWAHARGPVLWFDSDEAALRMLGCSSVVDAFEQHGEPAFREAERAAIVERASPPLRGVEVWSLGGGAILDPDVQRVVMESTVVWLDAPVDVLWERVAAAGDRPLAVDRSTFEQLHEQRAEVYRSLSTVRVDTACQWEDIGIGRLLADRMPQGWFGSGLVVGAGALDRIGELTSLCQRSVVLVGDRSVHTIVERVRRTLERSGTHVLVQTELTMGEWNKQMSTVEQLIERWAASGVHRDSVVIAIGGGTLLDTAGLAASIYKRGLDWVSVPTTVTAQVDAGVGGKTGVNLGAVKNVVGTVHMPVSTLIDPTLIESLPMPTAREGFVEAAKTGLLVGATLMEAVDICADLLARASGCGEVAHERAWLELVTRCASFKDDVVADDPFDTEGVRAQLNLGHTAGHAIEAASGGAIGHGEAVATGIAFALHLSQRRFGIDGTAVRWWERVCERLDLPVRSALPWDVLEPYIAHDKKRTADGVGWVLLERPGVPVCSVQISADEIADVWSTAVYDPGATGSGSRAGQRVLVLFGVNLGDLGDRDPEQYGVEDLATVVARIESWASEVGLVADCRQTDSLERFIAAVREARFSHAAIIVNPGAWTHTERALHDAFEPLDIPVVEVHFSAVDEREEWRRESVIAPVVDHRITGEGVGGYRSAIDWLAQRIARTPQR